MQAPKITQSYWYAIKLGYRNRGLMGVLPIFFVVTIIVPQFFADHVIVWLSSFPKEPNFYAIFPSFIVMGGFLGAVSINIMGQVFSITAHPEFSDYLKTEKAYDLYIFWPQFCLIVQIILIFSFVFSIVVYSIYGVGFMLARVLIFDAGIIVYALKNTLDLVDMIRTLAWHRHDYMSEKMK